MAAAPFGQKTKSRLAFQADIASAIRGRRNPPPSQKTNRLREDLVVYGDQARASRLPVSSTEKGTEGPPLPIGVGRTPRHLLDPGLSRVFNTPISSSRWMWGRRSRYLAQRAPHWSVPLLTALGLAGTWRQALWVISSGRYVLWGIASSYACYRPIAGVGRRYSLVKEHRLLG